eukprot:CAMPEP_0172161650 /NCGR_PEP_ID=MMETSP1050-20130122/6241_1 /TAXON_ID=233186 /ORGANISM="Cryptomonas curvata, Strain CCAP979/52" /LENGTH=294 /DNA_ID=CAMNT_0012831567 /DNA_START=154 /DNA_END=1034 /DNA_ORIENTATION=+
MNPTGQESWRGKDRTRGRGGRGRGNRGDRDYKHHGESFPREHTAQHQAVPDSMKENIRMLLRENMLRGDAGLLGSEIVPRYRERFGEDLDFRSMGYNKLGDFLQAMPSHVAIEHFRAGDFRARAADDLVLGVPTQETVVGSIVGEEIKDSAAWNSCDHYAQERDQEIEEPAANFAEDGEQYDEQHFEEGSNEEDNDDNASPSWTESAAAIMENQDFPPSYETRMDDGEFLMGGMHAFLLDSANKDLLSVVRQCYQTSKLLSHHEDISQELQARLRECERDKDAAEARARELECR